MIEAGSVTLAGAERETVTGRGPAALTVTLTAADVAVALAAVPYALAVRLWVPTEADVQTYSYGAAVAVPSRVAPS